MKATLIIVMALLLCAACTTKPKKKPVYYSANDDDDEQTTAAAYTTHYGEEVVVPYREQGGVKYIDVKVNGMGVEMIFDTGCSDALISVAEANYLHQKGKLSESDIQGVSQAQIADGSIVANTVITLHEVVIGEKIHCTNVRAEVSQNVDAPLLLGNAVLDKVETYTIDNANKVIKFKLKGE